MRTLIEAAFSRSRTVVMLLALILAVGSFSYLSIPKESSPDIPVPTVYVSIAYSGIAPEDAERLLVRPLETELQSLEGVDELAATATEGYAALTLEFDAGFESTAPSSPSSWPTAAWPGARIDVPPMPMRRGAWPGR